MLKCQFHCHSSEDPVDHISYTPKQAIEEAARLKYDVFTFTHHRKFIFKEEWAKFAKEKGIILIPGVEFEINKKHILGINVDKSIEAVDSFEKLKTYKEDHPDCLIIAPHPFFPGSTPLKKDLIKHIDLFDAIENSFCYTNKLNFNKKAKEIAQEHSKPYVATADCHILNCLDIGYTMVESDRNIESVIKAVKSGKIKNHHAPEKHFRLSKIFFSMMLGTLYKRFKR